MEEIWFSDKERTTKIIFSQGQCFKCQKFKTTTVSVRSYDLNPEAVRNYRSYSIEQCLSCAAKMYSTKMYNERNVDILKHIKEYLQRNPEIGLEE